MLPDLSWPNNFHKAEFDCLFIFHPGITVPINGVAYVEMGGGGGGGTKALHGKVKFSCFRSNSYLKRDSFINIINLNMFYDADNRLYIKFIWI